MKSRYTGILIASFFILGVLLSGSCKKEKLLTNGGELKFSTDTLTFDTVFTATGSFTIGIKIFNPQSQKIVISSVRLEKGDNSYFHLNVDGFPGNNITNLNVAANDSIYVYATVNINPNNDSMPFIVQDKLIATLNGKGYSIPMLAFGQNAHYLTDSIIAGSPVWENDKPYVIVRSALVDKGQTLTIKPGCRIYMNADSRLYVLGSLIADGTKKDSIIFQGDRLDRKYFGKEDYPGEWGGIYIDTGSTNNSFNWVVIKNGGNTPGGGFPAALWVSGLGGATQLTMQHTVISNSFGYGLLCFNASIKAENCLVNNTGAQALAIFQGGNYTITNCDFINYFPAKVNHTDNPSGVLLNYYKLDDTHYLAGNLTATLTNCLIYGSLDDEIICSRLNDANIGYNVTLNNCLLKTKDANALLQTPYVTTNVCKYNQDPVFKDYAKWNFRAKDNSSPMIDAGTTANFLSSGDLDDMPRQAGAAIDIGCYEAQ